MKWFNQHLNWTYVIINVIISVIGIILVFALSRDTLRSIIDNSDVLSLKVIVPLIVISGVLSLVSLAASAWVLSKKGQSLLWLILILVSSLVLFILVLVLPDNKNLGNNPRGEKGKITDAAYYQEREK